MAGISWRSLLYLITFLLFALAIVLWILTLLFWLVTEPGFEPLNVLAGAIVASLGGLLSLLGARKAGSGPSASSYVRPFCHLASQARFAAPSWSGF